MRLLNSRKRLQVGDGTMDDIDKIRTSVLSRIRPGDAEKQKLHELAHSMIERIDDLGKIEGLDIRARLVGSSARGTWLAGERDLDIFIMFQPDVTREFLEEKGLFVARKIAEKAESCEERYAEHPYISAVFDGFEVDIVPAFGVHSAADIRSAVDRTPFHNNYVLPRIRGFEDEVLLMKQFMKGAGIYGSELKTHGFSGYLVELLVIHCGSFMDVLGAACGWKPGMIIDIEKHASMEHKDPLIMVDPTDPDRNVAASLSLDNLCIFIDRACEFLENPDASYFNVKVPDVLDDDGFRKMVKARGTSLIAIEFRAPDVVEDVLFPQLHKMEESVKEMLERYDFRVYNSAVRADANAVLIFELEASGLPDLKKHAGPQVWSRQHALAFKSKYSDSIAFSNIHIRDGKYMVEIPRKYSNAKKLAVMELSKCSLGKHVGLSIKEGYRILEGDEILKIRDEEFRRFLRRFFEK